MARDITQDPLYDFFPDWVLENTRVEVRVPDRACDRCCNRTANLAGSRPAATNLIKIGSNPDLTTIIIHPKFYRPGTATGEALRGHEYYHVLQREAIPDFERLFDEEAQRVERAGLSHWDNIFEQPAYAAEREVRDELLARGFPL